MTWKAPAELPPQLLAFKRQQFRWAKGSVATLRKLCASVWNGGWPTLKRVAAFVHLGGYLIHPLLLLLLLVSPLLMLFGSPALLAIGLSEPGVSWSPGLVRFGATASASARLAASLGVSASC